MKSSQLVHSRQHLLVKPGAEQTVCESKRQFNFLLHLLTFRFLLWRSPMELTRVLGPRMMRVLWGHWVHTRLCSPSRILRMFSAPVTLMTGFPRRWVLNTFPWRSRLEMWKFEPWRVERDINFVMKQWLINTFRPNKTATTFYTNTWSLSLFLSFGAVIHTAVSLQFWFLFVFFLSNIFIS